MDFAAGSLERLLVLTGASLPKHLRRRMYGAIRLLRNRGEKLPRTRGV